MNVTVPFGTPLPGDTTDTVAVNVTVWPVFCGFTSDSSAVVVDAWLTTWLRADDVLALKFVSLPYSAVMLCAPAASPDVLNVATPPLNVPVPIVVPASLNVTVPVAVPTAGAVAVTVAVNVVLWPNTVGLTLDANAVVVSPLFTVCVSALDVLPLKFVSLP
jgi:hypothetical protein